MKTGIIAHRGFWLKSGEKNTARAFERAFSMGFGVETDVRDFGGKLVIAHDIPTSADLTFEYFLSIYKSFGNAGRLALNIKSDCLADLIAEALKRHKVENYFCFDASIPDTFNYLRANLNFYIRQSDVENNLHFAQRIQGFWMDEMESEWINATEITKLATLGRGVCIVSSELHRRPYENQWNAIKSVLGSVSGLQICTDFPSKANDIFNIEATKII